MPAGTKNSTGCESMDFKKLYLSDMDRYGKASPERGLKKLHYYLRKAQAEKNKLFSLYYRWRYKRIREKFHIEIFPSMKLGKGLYIGHPFGITVNPKAVLGDNINLHKGVTVGQENRGPKKGVPTIGNSVWVGVNATIVGNITIGDDVLIAPNSYVNCSVPSHSVVFGNPCIIKRKYNATAHYINNPVPMSDPEKEKQIWCGEEAFLRSLEEEAGK